MIDPVELAVARRSPRPTSVRRVFLPGAARRAAAAYFAALRCLYRLYDLHGEHGLVGTVRDLETTYLGRMAQAGFAMTAALGGRRRGRTAPDSLSRRAGWITLGVLDHAYRHCFLRRWREERRAWAPPLRAEDLRDPELREAFVKIEDLRLQVEQLGVTMGVAEKAALCLAEVVSGDTAELDRRVLEGAPAGATASPPELPVDPPLIVKTSSPAVFPPSTLVQDSGI